MLIYFVYNKLSCKLLPARIVRVSNLSCPVSSLFLPLSPFMYELKLERVSMQLLHMV